jgi:small-conductance mechanosensitive channel
MIWWHRVLIAAVLFGLVTALARFVDWRLSKRPLPPEAATRYRVFRRGVTTTILVVGFFSALLVIPGVRAVAGGLLASGAVIGVIVGFASQRTLGNFVAGLLIAIAQPLRLGDRVVVDGQGGIVEEIGLTYTFIRSPDGDRIVIPNEKLASDTIRNSTIRSAESVAEVTVPLPLAADASAVVEGLRELVAKERDGQVFVSSIDGGVQVTVRVGADDEQHAERLERDLLLRALELLRARGVFA